MFIFFYSLQAVVNIVVLSQSATPTQIFAYPESHNVAAPDITKATPMTFFFNHSESATPVVLVR